MLARGVGVTADETVSEAVATVEVKPKGAAVYARGAAPANAAERSLEARVAQLNQDAWAVRRADPERARELGEEACRLSPGPAGRAYGLLTLAFCAVDAFEFGEARRLVDAGMCAAQDAEDSYAEARAAFILGFLLTRTADYDAALELHRQSVARFVSLGDREGEATTLMYTAGVYLDRGAYDLARSTLERSLALFEELGDPEGRAQALLMMAIVYGYFGEYTAGLRANHEALSLLEGLGDVRGQVVVLNNLGFYYTTSGDGEKALECYLEGLKRCERLRTTEGRAMLLVNIAEIYSQQGDFATAVRYTEEGLAVNVALGCDREQVTALEILANIYVRAGNDERAHDYLTRARNLSETIGEVDMRVSVLRKLADLVCRQGEVQEAQALYETALALALQTQNRPAEADIRLGLGRIQSARGDLSGALEQLFRALELSQTLGLKRAVSDGHQALAATFERAENFAEALSHLKQGYALDKALAGETSSDRAQRLAAQFELEKLSRDAEIGRLKNVELARVNGALEAINEENGALLQQLREQAVKLEQQACEDALTGLHNRRHLEAALQAAFSAARRYRQPLSAVLIDIDDFKIVNDTLSHQVGDEVLRTVAKIFTRFVRSVDVVARYGGEEFALVLPETDALGALAVCERIRGAVAVHPWRELHPDLRVTVSIGVSDDLRVMDHEKLLALADGKLYEAKHAGKNRVVL